jgi:hypothetical protein
VFRDSVQPKLITACVLFEKSGIQVLLFSGEFKIAGSGSGIAGLEQDQKRNKTKIYFILLIPIFIF